MKRSFRFFSFWLLIALGAATVVFNSCGNDEDKAWKEGTDPIIEDESTIPNDVNGVVINGIRWATCNVAAPGEFVDKPIEVGMMYQWNRKIGWSINSNDDWDKSTPTGATWEKVNDPCPAGWRMPSQSELKALISSGSVYVKVNNVPGRKFGSGSNTIFLPFAGYLNRSDGKPSLSSTHGYYWSSSMQNNSPSAYYLYFTDRGSAHVYSSIVNGGDGHSCRCVAE